MRTYVISDFHAYHVNLAEGTSKWGPDHAKRPFKNEIEMTECIAHNINSVVKSDDRLICLGDWSLGGKLNIEKSRKLINCSNVDLILGNHDNCHGKVFNPQIRDNLKASDLFGLYKFYHEEFIEKKYFVFFHYPIYSWNHMNSGSIHLHGHTHSSPENKFFNGGLSMDVGLDGNNYMPYLINDIIEIMNSRPIASGRHH